MFHPENGGTVERGMCGKGRKIGIKRYFPARKSIIQTINSENPRLQTMRGERTSRAPNREGLGKKTVHTL